MTDLEDAFLKKNIPGQYSRWDDNDETAGDGGWSEDDHGAAAAPLTSSALAGGPPPTSNTGAKAVLADYRAAKEEEAYLREVERREREEILDRAVSGAKMKPGERSISAASVEERRRAERAEKARRRRGGRSESDDEDSGEEDADDEFLRSYREKRLQELRAKAGGGTPPVFGDISEVSPFQYAEAIDESDPRTTLVVHLYEPFVPACIALNGHLERLARSLPHVRFLRLRALEARPNFDTVGLPALLLHRGGELVHNLTPVTEHLPERFTADDVHELLGTCGAFTMPVSEEDQHTTQSSSAASDISRRIVRCSPTDEYDSDDAELDEYCADFSPSNP